MKESLHCLEMSFERYWCQILFKEGFISWSLAPFDFTGLGGVPMLVMLCLGVWCASKMQNRRVRCKIKQSRGVKTFSVSKKIPVFGLKAWV